ncbi:MAG: lasso RiPP family leader peptide-containing protein [Rhodospirillaceae bacterium]
MKADTTPKSPESAEDAKGAPPKKPYEAPVLVRWGTLHELTQAVGHSGASDGARKGATRTH